MKYTDFLITIALLLFSTFIMYLCFKAFKEQTIIEGLTNSTDNSTEPVSGEAGNAESYNSAVKSQLVKLQDELLVSKYRSDYENAIINLDDYIGYLMLDQTLNLEIGGSKKATMTALTNLNTLSAAKKSLNDTMMFLDKT